QMGFSLHQLLEALPELDAPGRAWLARQDPPNLAAAWAMAARAWRLDAEEALSAWFRQQAGSKFLRGQLAE
ncbi:urease accessory UreF family protein, partial [Pseudomonas aeruginosa]